LHHAHVADGGLAMTWWNDGDWANARIDEAAKRVAFDVSEAVYERAAALLYATDYSSYAPEGLRIADGRGGSVLRPSLSDLSGILLSEDYQKNNPFTADPPVVPQPEAAQRAVERLADWYGWAHEARGVWNAGERLPVLGGWSGWMADPRVGDTLAWVQVREALKDLAWYPARRATGPTSISHSLVRAYYYENGYSLDWANAEATWDAMSEGASPPPGWPFPPSAFPVTGNVYWQVRGYEGLGKESWYCAAREQDVFGEYDCEAALRYDQFPVRVIAWTYDSRAAEEVSATFTVRVAVQGGASEDLVFVSPDDFGGSALAKFASRTVWLDGPFYPASGRLQVDLLSRPANLPFTLGAVDARIYASVTPWPFAPDPGPDDFPWTDASGDLSYV